MKHIVSFMLCIALVFCAVSGLADLLTPSSPPPAIGTVTIVKSGYMNAYERDDKKSPVVFRVHHGERYLCTEETENGFYAICFLNGSIVYVPSDEKSTSLERGVTDAVTFSTCGLFDLFFVETTKKVDAYSQPKTGGQTRREDTDSTSTYYLKTGSIVQCFGKTVRENKEWYAVCPLELAHNRVPEILWVLASDCAVQFGDPDANIIPDWWYD
ncbi:MAG: hypothetical protein FWF69_00545 [Firmicutes bacterium]|nr:hypothetical protein [Bacillota bacterium]